MPKRKDIKSILIIGSGPIIIGQACEFDYSGTQACRALKSEGYRVILINSNPATIMTDPNIADATYVEPIEINIIEKIIQKERPDAILPTMGGQIALNCAVKLSHKGILKKFNVSIIGITVQAIEKAENRVLFNQAMNNIGLETAQSYCVKSIREALKISKKLNFPFVVRSSFAMGGSDSGIIYNTNDLKEFFLKTSRHLKNFEFIIDESLIGWKEYELEIIRDKKDNCLVICSIENVDPIGVHTGDSIAVSPAQTLSDKEYQKIRNAAIAIVREIGIDSGGANVQFAINPKSGKILIIEMNPRVSRSSALASKATGFPIAEISTKLSVGYTLDELMNKVTNNKIPIAFEPSLDYIVTKIPRFNFEKFSGSKKTLTTQMKSVGEVMAIGRNQQESLQKAIRSLELNIHDGFNSNLNLKQKNIKSIIYKKLLIPNPSRLWYIADAFRIGISVRIVSHLTKIDCWFLYQIYELIELESKIVQYGLSGLTKKRLFLLKQKGFSDSRLANLLNVNYRKIMQLRAKYDLHPVYKRIDTCAGEFNTKTAYMYSTYGEECEALPSQNKNKVLVLGSGPNRIGQGIEFDYCCVQALIALKKNKYETIMVNCNPETVSTDYDVANRLYFEPITLEDVLEIVKIENPKGIIIQCGGQTPLKLSSELDAFNIPILGTQAKYINVAENREKFKKIVHDLNLKQPKNAISTTVISVFKNAKIIGYPIIVRPSYVLGGSLMKIIYNKSELIQYCFNIKNISQYFPILLDEFLEHAIEIDVDAIFDGKNILICGILEHIEYAGIHSGDSTSVFPSYTLSEKIKNQIKEQTKKIAIALKIVGFINIQFAIQNTEIYLIEVNPRASRSIPFISKATGVSFTKISTLVMIGKSLLDQQKTQEILPPYFAVKEVTLPFHKFPGCNIMLGPEMYSTGEVMGINNCMFQALSKAIFSSQIEINYQFSLMKKAFLLFLNNDKSNFLKIVQYLLKYRFLLDMNERAAIFLEKYGIDIKLINKIYKKNINLKQHIIYGKYDYIAIFDHKNHMKPKIKKYFWSVSLKKKVYSDRNFECFPIIKALGTDPIKNIISLQEAHAQIHFEKK
ncbi:carbamoyl-phosphate synthase large subunit [Wigglesworthia glossinidia endosymbiont of Glossina morsitans morsitans (Yale colony)]|uniref:Carbamoyl-phosphate synthase large subunit n=1 Tax=Wigglesworthia glossinidia endosymbiont of Glossina morsitans morsitans (Yale colony) TaxID=1142511 RepID=H6Q4A3_WIGGL|nr:carbamoyl-phosphate synthase large subunit [Wigglesworthia glossinidia]AFA40886.1 carbamoyl-phosphate synthase large subunit [Wigglesworthia glossinidia endosymbiont of Glossina morsitans morsitans (Yale colony)]